MAGTSGEYRDGEHQQSGNHRFHFWRPGDWVRGNEHRLPAPPGQQKSTLSIVAIKKWRSLSMCRERTGWSPFDGTCAALLLVGRSVRRKRLAYIYSAE
jgi:hypothetical protein